MLILIYLLALIPFLPQGSQYLQQRRPAFTYMITIHHDSYWIRQDYIIVIL